MAESDLNSHQDTQTSEALGQTGELPSPQPRDKQDANGNLVSLGEMASKGKLESSVPGRGMPTKETVEEGETCSLLNQSTLERPAVDGVVLDAEVSPPCEYKHDQPNPKWGGKWHTNWYSQNWWNSSGDDSKPATSGLKLDQQSGENTLRVTLSQDKHESLGPATMMPQHASNPTACQVLEQTSIALQAAQATAEIVDSEQAILRLVIQQQRATIQKQTKKIEELYKRLEEPERIQNVLKEVLRQPGAETLSGLHKPEDAAPSPPSAYQLGGLGVGVLQCEKSSNESGNHRGEPNAANQQEVAGQEPVKGNSEIQHQQSESGPRQLLLPDIRENISGTSQAAEGEVKFLHGNLAMKDGVIWSPKVKALPGHLVPKTTRKAPPPGCGPPARGPPQKAAPPVRPLPQSQQAQSESGPVCMFLGSDGQLDTAIAGPFWETTPGQVQKTLVDYTDMQLNDLWQRMPGRMVHPSSAYRQSGSPLKIGTSTMLQCSEPLKSSMG